MNLTLKAAAVMLAVPFSVAHAQATGVSHPEEVPITTSPEGISQPVVYQPYQPTPAQPYQPTPAPVLKTRTPEGEAARYEPTPSSKPVLTASVVTPAAPPIETPADEPSSRFLTDKDEAGLHPGGNISADAGVITRIPGPANQLPAGSLLKVRLAQEISTRTTHAGTDFSGELAEALTRDGRVLLPAGSTVSGHVTEVHGGRRISGSASIHLEPTAVTLPDGTRYTLRAQVIDTEMFKSTRIDEEGTIIRRDHAMKTAAAFGLSAGSGAAAGAVFGGWPGAVIGAGIGAGVTTVVWLKQDRQTDMPTNTRIVFALSEPMTVGVE